MNEYKRKVALELAELNRITGEVPKKAFDLCLGDEPAECERNGMSASECASLLLEMARLP